MAHKIYNLFNYFSNTTKQIGSQKGFTLAEVLITLGIIGVVAALKMPSLKQNNKNKEATTRLKKFNSTMQQAILMSEAENGDISEWIQTSSSDTVTQGMTTEAFFMTYLAEYIKYIEITKGTNRGIKVYLPDSSSFQIYKGSCMDFLYDINGDRKPNEEGRDIFRFLACPKTDSSLCNGNGGWCSYHRKNDTTREARLKSCKNTKRYCSGFIEYDDWEFKSDYPYRL